MSNQRREILNNFEVSRPAVEVGENIISKAPTDEHFVQSLADQNVERLKWE